MSKKGYRAQGSEQAYGGVGLMGDSSPPSKSGRRGRGATIGPPMVPDVQPSLAAVLANGGMLQGDYLGAPVLPPGAAPRPHGPHAHAPMVLDGHHYSGVGTPMLLTPSSFQPAPPITSDPMAAMSAPHLLPRPHVAPMRLPHGMPVVSEPLPSGVAHGLPPAPFDYGAMGPMDPATSRPLLMPLAGPPVPSPHLAGRSQLTQQNIADFMKQQQGPGPAREGPALAPPLPTPQHVPAGPRAHAPLHPPPVYAAFHRSAATPALAMAAPGTHPVLPLHAPHGHHHHGPPPHAHHHHHHQHHQHQHHAAHHPATVAYAAAAQAPSVSTYQSSSVEEERKRQKRALNRQSAQRCRKRKRAMLEDLKRSNKLFSTHAAILDSLNTMNVEFRVQTGIVTFVQGTRQLGWEPAEVQEQTLYSFLEPSTRTKVEQLIRQLIEDWETTTNEGSSNPEGSGSDSGFVTSDTTGSGGESNGNGSSNNGSSNGDSGDNTSDGSGSEEGGGGKPKAASGGGSGAAKAEAPKPPGASTSPARTVASTVTSTSAMAINISAQKPSAVVGGAPQPPAPAPPAVPVASGPAQPTKPPPKPTSVSSGSSGTGNGHAIGGGNSFAGGKPAIVHTSVSKGPVTKVVARMVLGSEPSSEAHSNSSSTETSTSAAKRFTSREPGSSTNSNISQMLSLGHPASREFTFQIQNVDFLTRANGRLRGDVNAVMILEQSQELGEAECVWSVRFHDRQPSSSRKRHRGRGMGTQGGEGERQHAGAPARHGSCVPSCTYSGSKCAEGNGFSSTGSSSGNTSPGNGSPGRGGSEGGSTPPSSGGAAGEEEAEGMVLVEEV